MELTANHVVLRGSLDCLPQFSHENHGRRFFRFSLEVPRLSGTVDTLPVIAQEEILNEVDLSDGEMLTVTGQVRSHNLRENGRRDRHGREQYAARPPAACGGRARDDS